MGIPFYIASLLKSHKHIQQNCNNGVLDYDALGIDFNCFIHKYLREDNPVGSIVAALEDLLTQVVRAKHVYIAFDGLVPYAKMVQQRYRRMRKSDAGGFDKHQISPGTPFMKDLADTLKFLYPNVVISGTDEPGEGEHKIFLWLRSLPADERKNICIYGLDADLVLIAIAQSHLGHIQVIREREDNGFATISIPALMSVLPVDPDTYVRASILLFGNDFLPNFAMFSLRKDGYPRAMHYLKGPGLKAAAGDEMKVLRKHAQDTDRRIVATDCHALESRFALHIMDGVLDWEPVVYAFKKTYEWTLHYFTTSEVLDWTWYYPYPEAPLFATWDEFPVTEPFVWDNPTPPYTVEDQLRFILPERSLRTSGLEPTIPDELYEEGVDSRHPWMRRFAWECDPYISVPLGQMTSVDEVHLESF
jgi:5'-3' exonuclease